MEDFKRDYPELMDKEIALIRKGGRKVDQVIMIGCNFDIGFSLVSADNKEKMIFCGHGPLAPKWKEHYSVKANLESWTAEFKNAMKQIGDHATLDIDRMMSHGNTPVHGIRGGASMETCSFNQ
jgi:hypothetical protein